MSVQLHCEGCGKLLRASGQTGGKQSKCPACGHSVYIPTPEDQLEELPLAPEDTEELQREVALQEERLRLERSLVREGSGPPAAGADERTVSASNAASQVNELSIQKTVIAYLVALRDSDLTAADKALAILRRNKEGAHKALDRLTTDELEPAELANVPRAVYGGFLKNLRSQL